MNGILTVQVIAFIIFMICVLDVVVGAVVRQIFPSWSRGVVATVAMFLIVTVLVSSVPGRQRHLDFLKGQLTDAVAERNFNGGGTGLSSWLGNALAGLTAEVVLQSIRVESHLGLVSIGYWETEKGWQPMSVGFAGIICRNFFFVRNAYEMPQASVAYEKDVDGNGQIVLSNQSDAPYECAVFSNLNPAAEPLRRFDLDAQSFVRIKEAKKGFLNKVRNALDGDRTRVWISEMPLHLFITFRRGGQVMKRAELFLGFGDRGFRTYWNDPK